MQKKAQQIFDFMNVVEQMCLVKRDIIRSDGAPDTTADHTLKMAFLLMMILPYLQSPIDVRRCYELILVHDLAEVCAGDVPLLTLESCADARAAKEQREIDAIEKYREALPPEIGEKIYDLYKIFTVKIFIWVIAAQLHNKSWWIR